MTGKSKSKSSKTGGATFGYVEQFNYPLSPCYKNQAKAGWHSGGDGSCAKKTVEGLTPSENEISGGGFFDWIMGKGDKKKSTSTSGKKKKSTSSSTSETADKKKKKKSSSTAAKKKPSKK
jgi:hypothetical protein